MSPPGPPVLLLHGVAGSGLIWSELVDRLSGANELLAVDLLGYGHSPKPWRRYTPEVHLDAIHRTVAEQLDGRDHVVMGLSMGCLLAVDYAARHPEGVTGVVNLGLPYYRDRGEARRGLRANVWTALTVHAPPLAAPLISALWAIGRRSSWLRQLMAPTIYTPEVARETMLARYHSFASTLRHCLVEHRITPSLDALGALPVTFVHGTEDRWCPPERIAELIAGRANCELHVIDGVGHNLAVLAPEEVVRLTSNALR